jgi:hypothetical protein
MVAVLVSGTWFATAQDAPKEPAAKGTEKPAAPADVELSEFMRKKLDASNKILEGLCTEDMALVKEGASALNEISNAERWRVSNDPLYRQFSADFRSLTQELTKAAEGGNEDRVALKWMDTTMSCLDCHRFVRGMRVVGSK